jgi:hypothetical protein
MASLAAVRSINLMSKGAFTADFRSHEVRFFKTPKYSSKDRYGAQLAYGASARAGFLSTFKLC